MQATETAWGHVADVVGIQTPGGRKQAGMEKRLRPGEDGPCNHALNMLINKSKTGPEALTVP